MGNISNCRSYVDILRTVRYFLIRNRNYLAFRWISGLAVCRQSANVWKVYYFFCHGKAKKQASEHE
jgi:hypothetical protein